MQHQPEAYASDLGDGSHVTCDYSGIWSHLATECGQKTSHFMMAVRHNV